MLIDKEYPATHSNDTAWFCVDLDGNIAVFDIEENGPTPNDFEGEHCIADFPYFITTPTFSNLGKFCMVILGNSIGAILIERGILSE